MTTVRVQRPRQALDAEKLPVEAARVRRARPVQQGLSAPVVASGAETARVRRTRPAQAPTEVKSGRKRYIVDWGSSLSAKFCLYMMTSYLYYHRNYSVVTDHEYDRLCKEILAGWDRFDHPHKHLISRDDLEATTGYAIKYPTVVKIASSLLADTHIEVRSS